MSNFDLLKTLCIIIPVILMLILGFFCTKIGILNREGTNIIKKYIINIALPVAVFHAMATAEYNISVVLIFVIMLSCMIAGLSIGYLLRKFVKDEYRPYFPFLMTVYEGGLLGYPLYSNICGAEHLSTLAILDFAGMIFGFGIYFSLIALIDQGKKIQVKDIVKSAFTSPTFIAVLLGMAVGITGLMPKFLSMDGSVLYTSAKDFITAPMNSMILLCVGADFMLEKSLIKECLKTIAARLVLSLIFLGIVLTVFKLIHVDGYMMMAVIMYLTLTPSFALSTFVKKEQTSKYIATTISLYMPISIVVYVLLAIFSNHFIG